MYLSLNWLKDFVDIPRSMTPEELGLRLTMHTVEIDSVEKQAEKFANIVVGKILEIKKHPNADKLQLVKVDTNKGNLDIVCGAFNIKVGQMVPVALMGAELSNGMKIEEVEIRGIKSFGMLCAEDELGLGDDHAGIMILEKGVKVGQNFADYLRLEDVIFEVDNKSITHRPDLWGHYGLAREISAFLGVKLKKYNANLQIYANTANENNANMRIDVKVEDFELCPRYMAVAMSGVKIEPSPKWMQERLIAVGAKPINNIVDITNYVMFELGQPLHAFDKSLVDKIIVRRAKKNEIIETLDGEKRELAEDILVIADSQKAIAVAGVMGGVNSEIGSDTNEIILESANFNFVSIRKTVQVHGLRTEASMRFEKALDPNLCELALARVVELIKKLCPTARVSSELKDEKKYNLNQGPVMLDLKWLNKRSGVEIAKKKVIEILERLGFTIEKKNEKMLQVTVPTWRATRDVAIKEDILEETIRIYGYDKLKYALPAVEMKSPMINYFKTFERRVKAILSGAPALTEVYNYSFVGDEQLKKLSIDTSGHIRLVNPINANHTTLRQSLIPNLINNVKTNQARFEYMGFFEIGSVYFGVEGIINKDNKTKATLPYQEKHLGIVMVGPSAPACADRQAGGSKLDIFRKTKGVISYLLNTLHLDSKFSATETVPAWADKQTAANIMANEKSIGIVCQLDHCQGRSLGLKKEVVMAEINLPEFLQQSNINKRPMYEEYEKYPPVVRDLAFVVGAKILYNNIREEIINFSEFIKSVELFDVYQGGKLGKDKKNLAFHIIYQAAKTLTSGEVDKIQQNLIKHVEERFDAKIRDF